MKENTATHDITITFMSGAWDGKTLHFGQPTLGEERVLTIGRRETCDVHLSHDNQASRVHARLGIVSTPFASTDSVSMSHVLSFWIEDGDSRNGTYIGKSIQPIQKRENLRPGELFRVGRTWLRVDVPLSI